MTMSPDVIIASSDLAARLSDWLLRDSGFGVRYTDVEVTEYSVTFCLWFNRDFGEHPAFYVGRALHGVLDDFGMNSETVYGVSGTMSDDMDGVTFSVSRELLLRFWTGLVTK